MLKVVRPQERRLQCGLTDSKRWSLQKSETIFQGHNIYSKVREIYISERYPPPPRFTEKIHIFYKEREQYMKNAEKECSKSKMGVVDFSPEVIVWKNRRGVWNSLIRCHQGGWLNREIIKRRAKACGMQRPLRITLLERSQGIHWGRIGRDL